MGIPVPLFWLRTFYVEFRWSPDEVHLESRYIEYKYANSSIFQVDSRWTPDGYWSPAGVHLNSVGECKVLVVFISSNSLLRLSLCSAPFFSLCLPSSPIVTSCHFNCIAVSVSEILVFHDGDRVSFHFRNVISVSSSAGLMFAESNTLFFLLLHQLLCATSC
jgi:hypothetical protein